MQGRFHLFGDKSPIHVILHICKLIHASNAKMYFAFYFAVNVCLCFTSIGDYT